MRSEICLLRNLMEQSLIVKIVKILGLQPRSFSQSLKYVETILETKYIIIAFTRENNEERNLPVLMA